MQFHPSILHAKELVLPLLTAWYALSAAQQGVGREQRKKNACKTFTCRFERCHVLSQAFALRSLPLSFLAPPLTRLQEILNLKSFMSKNSKVNPCSFSLCKCSSMLHLSYTHQKKIPVLNLLLQGVQGVGAATVQTPVWGLSWSQ